MSSYDNNKAKKRYIPPEETKRLNQQSRDEMLIADPEPILRALNIDYTVHNNGTQYLFKSHSESTPSTRFKLFNSGVWAWKNFATDDKGSIIKLIEKHGRYSYEHALQFYYANMPGSRNYFQEALQLEKLSESYLAEVEQKKLELEAKRDANRALSEKYGSTSKVTDAYLIYNKNEKANEFYRKRGLDKNPPFIMTIKGEYEKYYIDSDEIITKSQIGIGVLTGNIKKHIETIKTKQSLDENIGGDIHYFEAFTKKDGSIAKTQSFGAKTFSYWFSNNENNKDTVLIFESKFDAAAAYCYNPEIWNDYNGVIANGVNVAPDIVNFIKEQGFSKIINYNQNDLAGVIFSYNILKDLERFDKNNNYTYIKYNINELKEDINDLYKKGKFDDKRFQKSFKTQVNNFISFNKKNISEKMKLVSREISTHIAIIDEKLIRMVNLNRDLTSYLSSEELRRFEKLQEQGFLKDNKKIKTLQVNKGRKVEDLVFIHEINQKKEEIQELKEILNKEGDIKMNIKTNLQLKDALYKINLSSNNFDNDWNLIEEYVIKNSTNAELNKTIDEWIAYSCENNTKETIEAAKCFYFVDLEDALDRTFKLINIGKNLNNSKSVDIKKENIVSNDATKLLTDLTVKEDAFLEDGNLLLEEEEESKVEEKVEIKVNKIDSEQTVKIEESKQVQENVSTNIDLEFEMKQMEHLITKAKNDLETTKSLETVPEIKTLKLEVVTDNKNICNSVWNRLNNKDFCQEIIKITDNDKKKEMNERRMKLGQECKKNIELSKEIETQVSNATQSSKVKTDNISSQDFITNLYKISNKVTNIVEFMKATLSDLKKNNEVIQEQMMQINR